MMHILVCGSREYANRDKVYQVLDLIRQVTPVSLIIHGEATGADTFAKEWALSRHVPQKGKEPDWASYGNYAGNVRNQRMLDENRVDLVIAFSTGQGTRDMIGRATNANIPVSRFR